MTTYRQRGTLCPSALRSSQGRPRPSVRGYFQGRYPLLTTSSRVFSSDSRRRKILQVELQSRRVAPGVDTKRAHQVDHARSCQLGAALGGVPKDALQLAVTMADCEAHVVIRRPHGGVLHQPGSPNAKQWHVVVASERFQALQGAHGLDIDPVRRQLCVYPERRRLGNLEVRCQPKIGQRSGKLVQPVPAERESRRATVPSLAEQQLSL